MTCISHAEIPALKRTDLRITNRPTGAGSILLAMIPCCDGRERHQGSAEVVMDWNPSVQPNPLAVKNPAVTVTCGCSPCASMTLAHSCSARQVIDDPIK